MAIERLMQGIHHFQTEIFDSQRELFERLARGQNPTALFITCSDSRINPNLITQTDPGELFILRNAGNIVPPYGLASGGEAGTIEFAVAALGVRHIIVCGHSHCGAMRSLLRPELIENLPAVRTWLAHAEPTRRIVEQNYRSLDDAARDRVRSGDDIDDRVARPEHTLWPNLEGRGRRLPVHLGEEASEVDECPERGSGP